MNWRFFLVALVLFFQGGWAQATVRVTAEVDRSRMSLGDSFTYTIRISSEEAVEVSDPRLPSVTGLELINSWRGSESRSTFEGGRFRVEQSQSFNYLFVTQREGPVSVGSAEVVVNGESYRTSPVTVEVRPARPGQQAPPTLPPRAGRPPDPFGSAFGDVEELFDQLLRRRAPPGFRSEPVNPEEAFFIQVEVDKTEAYVGEQITASWYLYTRGHIREIDTLEYPSVHGFWKEDIEMATRLNFEQEVVNGVAYRRALLASYALFPMTEGTLEVDSYKARCTVVMPGDFGLGRPYQFTKASQPVPIRVKPLPLEDRPSDFAGAVGQFSMTAQVDRQQVKAHEPVVLRLHVQGRGNAKLIDLPPLNLPESLELYDSKQEAEFFRDGRSEKTFELLLIPRQAGEIELPSISMSAFDPQLSQYYQFQTEPITLTVLPGEGSEQGPLAKSFLAGDSGRSSRATGLVAPEIILQWRPSRAGLAGVSPWLVWPGVYLGVLALLGWRAHVEWGWRRGKKDLRRILQLRLQKVNSLLGKGQWRAASVEMTNLLYQILGEISGQGGASQELHKLLAEGPPSLRRELGEELEQILDRLATLSFAPEEVVGQLKSEDQLKKLVERTRKALIRAIELTDLEEEYQGTKVGSREL